MNLHEYLRRSVADHPDAAAVTAPDGKLTYRQLGEVTEGIAAHLASLGVSRGDRVVVWADKSARTVATFLAALRLGAAYVPIDAATPANRAATIVRDCEPRVVCTHERNAVQLRRSVGRSVGYMDPQCPYTALRVPPTAAPEPDDPAYILYTSGSTGVPKGVCLSQRNAVSFVEWAASELDARSGDRFANHAPLTFDLSVLDLFVPLLAGASVHLVPPELAYAPVQLARFVRAHEISVWYSVPSALVLMARDGGLLDQPAPRSLRAILFAGEPFPIEILRRIRAWTEARMLNLYGPTETNVCTFHEPAAADYERDRPVPIGRACCGDRVWALTEDGHVAGPDEEGELMVDGPTVMLGYWGKPPQEGPYATGDIVRVLDDGVFDYVGRRDHMVKVRGHRVELGDVEAALEAHPAVTEATVVVTGTGEEARLEAFVVPVAEPPGLLSVKRHCSEHLPRYMIVDAVHALPALPRTANGKVDRRALVEGRLQGEGAR